MTPCTSQPIHSYAEAMFDDYQQRRAEIPYGLNHYGLELLATTSLHQPMAVRHVEKLLFHAATWRGQTARDTKAALRAALKEHARHCPVNVAAPPPGNVEPVQPRPVPSDQDLPDGVKPFTAFGQYGYGHLDLRVFDQDTWWVDIHGRPHLLTEMSEEYRHNVIRHLEANRDYLHSRVALAEAIDLVEYTFTGAHNPTSASAVAGAPTTHEVDPEAWLEATPLMRRLRRLTGP